MKRKIALLLALVMVLSMVPMMSFAASGSITASVPSVGKAAGGNLGNITMTLPAGSLTAGESFYLDLNNDAKFSSNVVGSVYSSASQISGFGVLVDGTKFSSVSGGGDVVSARRVSNSRVEVTFNADVKLDDNATVIFVLKDVNTAKSSTGTIEATVVAAPGSPFPTGKVEVASIGDSRQVTLETGSLKESKNAFTFNLKVKEDNPSAIQTGSVIELELPVGFKWDTDSRVALGALPTTNPDPGVWYYKQYGDDLENNVKVSLDSKREVLSIEFDGTMPRTRVSSFEIRGLSFTAEDTSKIKEGDIVAKVTASGGLKRNVSKLTVGTYGDYAASLVVEDDIPTIFSGQFEQEVVKMLIKESISNSLVIGRDVELALPSYAKWTATGESAGYTYEDEELELRLLTNVDEDNPNRILKFRVDDNATGDPATIELEEYEVAVEAGFEGDLVVTVSGAGIEEQEVVIAKVIKPVALKSKETPTVIIGRADQKVGDIVITENAEEAFLDEEDVVVSLALPSGVRFSKTPKVEVTDGDLIIESVAVTSGSGFLRFNIDRRSSEASEITISDVYITVDRTVPEGGIIAELTGGDIIQTNVEDYWINSDTAADVVIATVGTPAPVDTTTPEVVLTIGSTTMFVDGVATTASAAPYIDENNRTMLPVSAIGRVLGANVDWNASARTVLITKDDNRVLLTIDKDVMNVNGMEIPMRSKAVITNDRTFVPLKDLGVALGVNIEWDAATQTVTVK